MLVLASGSPRRRELLEKIGLKFEIVTSDADETPTKSIPADVVEELSAKKAEDVYGKLSADERFTGEDESLIIAADTLVFLGNERMGKPKDAEDARVMLSKLSGKTHQVFTGVTLVYVNHGNVKKVSFHEKTDVTVYPLSESEISEYIATKEPMDKAGAYAIQGYFVKYIQLIHGEYSNVVGLPIARLYHEIEKIGYTKKVTV